MTETEAIKNEIRNLPYYTDEMKRLKDLKAQLIYEEENVKGVSFDRQPGTTNPSVQAEKRFALIERIVMIDEELAELSMLINRVKRILNAMQSEDRVLVIEILVRRKPYADVIRDRGIASTSVLHRRINAIIEEAVKKA